MAKSEIAILILGFSGQTLFFMHFFAPWRHSEKYRRGMIPTAFWPFGIGGSTLLRSAAGIRKDRVFIVGPSAGFFVCTRNRYPVAREPREQEATNG